MNNKSELLNQLKIDRSETETTKGISVPVLVLLMLLSLMAGGAGGWALFSEDQGKEIKGAGMNSSSSGATASSQTSSTNNTGESDAAKPVVKKDVSEKILNASGYITARRMATVSAEVMGLITQVNVEEGMAVEQGQVLAQLDSAVARVNLEYAQAQKVATEYRLGSIRANLAEAKRVLKRAKELKSNNYSSVAELTRAQANMESLEAELVAAKANIKVAEMEVQRQQERLDDHTIKAPFSGIVTVKNAQPGEIVAPSSAGGGFTRTGICTIVDMGSLEIEVDVNEAFIGRVFDGQKVEANLDAYPDWTIPASVIAVIPTADRAKATVRVRIKIEARDSRILPDMGVKVAFLKS